MKVQLMDLSLYSDYLKEKRMIAESTIEVYTATISMFLTTNPDLVSVDDYNNFIINDVSRSKYYFIFNMDSIFLILSHISFGYSSLQT